MPGARRRWGLALAGLLSLLATAWVLLVGPVALSHLHPARTVLLAVTGLLGLALLIAGVRRRPSPGRWRRIGAGLVAAVVLPLAAASAWMRPMPATDTTVADGAVLESRTTELVLVPAEGEPRAGLVFQPGAAVDPEAYVPMLSRVAAAGYEVVIVRQPLEIGFLAMSAPERIIAEHPEVTVWAVGGHSLGGVAAAQVAAEPSAGADGVAALVLWASYPATDISGESGLAVTSISGSRDGLTTPAEVTGHAGMLPADTTYVVVDGGIHSYFGDYGHQRGDGEAQVDRATAQDEIVDATVVALAELAEQPS